MRLRIVGREGSGRSWWRWSLKPLQDAKGLEMLGDCQGARFGVKRAKVCREVFCLDEGPPRFQLGNKERQRGQLDGIKRRVPRHAAYPWRRAGPATAAKGRDATRCRATLSCRACNRSTYPTVRFYPVPSLKKRDLSGAPFRNASSSSTSPVGGSIRKRWRAAGVSPSFSAHASKSLFAVCMTATAG